MQVNVKAIKNLEIIAENFIILNEAYKNHSISLATDTGTIVSNLESAFANLCFIHGSIPLWSDETRNKFSDLWETTSNLINQITDLLDDLNVKDNWHQTSTNFVSTFTQLSDSTLESNQYAHIHAGGILLFEPLKNFADDVSQSPNTSEALSVRLELNRSKRAFHLVINKLDFAKNFVESFMQAIQHLSLIYLNTTALYGPCEVWPQQTYIDVLEYGNMFMTKLINVKETVNGDIEQLVVSLKKDIDTNNQKIIASKEDIYGFRLDASDYSNFDKKYVKEKEYSSSSMLELGINFPVLAGMWNAFYNK